MHVVIHYATAELKYTFLRANVSLPPIQVLKCVFWGTKIYRAWTPTRFVHPALPHSACHGSFQPPRWIGEVPSLAATGSGLSKQQHASHRHAPSSQVTQNR